MSSAYPWPDGRRAALCVTFDFDGESPHLWRQRHDPPADIAELEQRRYGPRRGIHHLLEMLGRAGIRATFFVPGWIAQHYRSAVQEVHAAGHELALHGWCHEPPTAIGEDELRDTLTRAADLLGEISGRRPVGYRSPSFQMTPGTFDVLAGLGLRYDSSVMGDDRPYRIGELVEVPVDWATDDAVYYRYTSGGSRPPLGADALQQAWAAEIAGARASGTLVNLTMHPWLSGRPARVHRLHDLIEAAQESGEIWIGTAGDLAEHHRGVAPSAATTEVAADALGLAAMTGPLLDVRDLHVSFGTGMDAVSGLALTVDRGETVAVVGESGCGKTLSALALSGLLPVGATATGSALLGGTELIGRSERQLRRLRGDKVGMIFQDASTALNPLMSVGAQIEEVMAIHGTLGRAARRARAVELLESVGVPDAAHRAGNLPHQLSGGMRQRVMIAIALAGSPDLVIADEPTTALDVTVQAQVLALLRESTRDSAVLFITHDMGVVAEIADRVVVMYAGTVVESGPLAEVLERPHHPYTAALLASVPDPDAPHVGELPTIPGRVPPLGRRGSGCPFRDRCPKAQSRCQELPVPATVAGGRSAVACWYPEHTTEPPGAVEEVTR